MAMIDVTLVIVFVVTFIGWRVATDVTLLVALAPVTRSVKRDFKM